MKKLFKAICIVLCAAMLLGFAAIADEPSTGVMPDSTDPVSTCQEPERPLTGRIGDNAYFSIDRETQTARIYGSGETYSYPMITPCATEDGDFSTVGCSPLCSWRIIKSAVIEDGITGIGDYIFDSCSELETVWVAASVTKMADRTFHDCFDLKSIYFLGDAPAHSPMDFYDKLYFNPTGSLYPNETAVYHLPDAKGWDQTPILYYFDYDNAAFYVTEAQVFNGEPVETPDEIQARKVPWFKDQLWLAPVNKWYYCDALLWAADGGIVSGYEDNTFRPNNTCTRGHVVTFLWRAAGCPEPESLTNPFSDVSESSPFYKAILWASEQGITTGYADGTFRPNAACTRAHVVTFLWRYEKKPAATGDVTLTDLDGLNADFTSAIKWAASKGITTGYSDGSFRPSAVCTRAHVVTFLYRDIEK